MKFQLILVFILITITSAKKPIFGQSQIKKTEYEIGAMFASNTFVKMNGSISVVDSTLNFTIGDKT